MARQVLPIVGAVVGYFAGSPQIGYMIGSMLGNAVDPQIIKGPSIGDGVQQTSKEGVPRPIVYGRGCVAGNLIDRSPIRKWKQRNRGSKGGPVHEEERISMTFAIRICEGPIGGLLRIWEDEKLVYDARPESQIVEESARYAERFRFYRGTEDQLPDPALEAIRDPGETPSYRGTAYIVFDDLDVTDRRGSVPNFRFEVEEEMVEPVADMGISLVTSGAVYDLDVESGDLSFSGYVSPGPSPGAFWLNQPVSNFNGSMFIFESSNSLTIYKRSDSGYDGTSLNLQSDIVRVLDISWSPTSDTFAVLWVDSESLNGSFYIDTYNVVSGGVVFVDRSFIVSADHSVHPEFFLKFSPDPSRVYFSLSSRGPVVIPPVPPVSQTGFVELTSGHISDPVFENLSRNIQGAKVDPGDKELLACFSTNRSSIGEFDITLISARDGVHIEDNLVSIDIGGIPFFGGRYPIEWASNSSGVFVSGIYDGVPGIYFCKVERTPSGGAYFDGPPVLASTYGAETHRVESLDRFSVYGQDYIFAQAAGRTVGEDNQVWALKEEGESLSLAFPPFVNPAGGDFNAFPTHNEDGNSGGVPVSTQATLSHVLTDLADRVKFNPDRLNLEEVGDTVVRGFVVAGTYEGQNVIRSLQDSFLFDPAEWDGLIHFVPRGKPVVAVINDEEHLVEEPVDELRENAREYPQRLELFYQNPDIDYAAAKAVAERLSDDYDLSGAKVVEVPVTMTVDEAWQVADMQLKVAWEEAKGQVTLTLPNSFDYLTPTDCIGFFRRGIGHRVRITEVTQQDGTLEVKAHYDRESAYRSDVVGLPVIPPTPPPSTIAGPTVFQFLNLPALIDQLDPLLHYYYGATGRSDAWYGASIQRRIDDDDFEEVSRVTTNARMGELEEPLAYASEHYPDTTNSILVRMYRDDDDLEAVSDSQLLREQNAIAISRPDGTAEIIQFRDVEDLGDRLFRLSYLIRGRLNSGADTHETGARLTVLDDVMSVSADPILIGQELEHRPVSFGESPEDAPIHEDTWQPPLSQVEWPVAELDAEREGDSLAIAWSPRERFGTDVNPIRSTNWQAYRVNVTDGANAVSVDVLQPNAVVDVSSMTGPITVAVSQVNRYTGPGPATILQVD